MKKIRTITRMAVMALAAAVLLAGCSRKSDPISDDISDDTPSYGVEVYDGVLAEYRDMVQNDFYMDLLGTEEYDSSFGEHIGAEIRSYKQSVYYAFYDIDGNGTRELVIAAGQEGIGVGNPSFYPIIYELYGYDGTQVVSLFPEMEFGYQAAVVLYGDGVMGVALSGSAGEWAEEFYKIGQDGLTPELMDSYGGTLDVEDGSFVSHYFKNGEEITEEEYLTNLKNYGEDITLELEWEAVY